MPGTHPGQGERRQSSTSSQVDEHHPFKHIPVNIQIAGSEVWRTPGLLGLQTDTTNGLQELSDDTATTGGRSHGFQQDQVNTFVPVWDRTPGI